MFTKESLFALEQDRYDALVKELEGLKEEADLLPPTEAPALTKQQGTPMYHSAPSIPLNGSVGANTPRETHFAGKEIIFTLKADLGTILITDGMVPNDTIAAKINNRVKDSKYYLHVIN
jgi:hypothetical protein